MKSLIAFILLTVATSSFATIYECSGRNSRDEAFQVRYSAKSITVASAKDKTVFTVVDWKEAGANVNATGVTLLSHIFQSYLYVQISVRPGQNESEVKLGTPTVMSGMKWDKPLLMTCL